MKTIRTKEELKKGLKNNEKEFKVIDKKLIRALAVQFWIQKNPVKGTALLAALPLSAGTMAVSAPGTAPVAAIVGGAGITAGSVTISVVEIVTIGLLVIALIAVLKGQKIIEVDIPNGRVKFN